VVRLEGIEVREPDMLEVVRRKLSPQDWSTGQLSRTPRAWHWLAGSPVEIPVVAQQYPGDLDLQVVVVLEVWPVGVVLGQWLVSYSGVEALEVSQASGYQPSVVEVVLNKIKVLKWENTAIQCFILFCLQSIYNCLLLYNIILYTYRWDKK
jgi:hypothetical protein